MLPFEAVLIRKTLQKYNLPSPEEILENPPKKQQ
jgi:hypothetical protein